MLPPPTPPLDEGRGMQLETLLPSGVPPPLDEGSGNVVSGFSSRQALPSLLRGGAGVGSLLPPGVPSPFGGGLGLGRIKKRGHTYVRPRLLVLFQMVWSVITCG